MLVLLWLTVRVVGGIDEGGGLRVCGCAYVVVVVVVAIFAVCCVLD
jgi:hypothetical protein